MKPKRYWAYKIIDGERQNIEDSYITTNSIRAALRQAMSYVKTYQNTRRKDISAIIVQEKIMIPYDYYGTIRYKWSDQKDFDPDRLHFVFNDPFKIDI